MSGHQNFKKYSAYLIYVRLKNMLGRYVFSPNMYGRMFCILNMQNIS